MSEVTEESLKRKLENLIAYIADDDDRAAKVAFLIAERDSALAQLTALTASHAIINDVCKVRETWARRWKAMAKDVLLARTYGRLQRAKLEIAYKALKSIESDDMCTAAHLNEVAREALDAIEKDGK